MTWSRAKNTKDKLLTPRPCRACGRLMSREFLIERNVQRGKNISAALVGSTVGRPVTTDRAEVLRLRSLGWTIRRIAAQLSCSTWSVHRAIKAKDRNQKLLSSNSKSGKD